MDLFLETWNIHEGKGAGDVSRWPVAAAEEIVRFSPRDFSVVASDEWLVNGAPPRRRNSRSRVSTSGTGQGVRDTYVRGE